MSVQRGRGSTENASSLDHQALLAEYTALRAEILESLQAQTQLISLTILAVGALFAAGIQSKNAALILLYPLLAVFLSATWAYNERGLRQIGIYIKDRIEERVGTKNIGWEHFHAQRNFGKFGRLNAVAARGIFIGTELLAIFAGISLGHFDTFDIGLLITAIRTAIVTLIILWRFPTANVSPQDDSAEGPIRNADKVVSHKQALERRTFDE